jgi:hypothetical protein
MRVAFSFSKCPYPDTNGHPFSGERSPGILHDAIGEIDSTYEAIAGEQPTLKR